MPSFLKPSQVLSHASKCFLTSLNCYQATVGYGYCPQQAWSFSWNFLQLTVSTPEKLAKTGWTIWTMLLMNFRLQKVWLSPAFNLHYLLSGRWIISNACKRIGQRFARKTFATENIGASWLPATDASVRVPTKTQRKFALTHSTSRSR